jgi:hypothetical protein
MFPFLNPLQELRLECYLQTQVATGNSPQPVETPSSAIPPSFTPWCQENLVPEDTNIKRAKIVSELDALPRLSVCPGGLLSRLVLTSNSA